MVRRADSLSVQYNEHMRGGDGTVELRHFLNKEDFQGKGRLFSMITLEPGCSIGYHVHENEAEIFAVLEGEGRFNDNGAEIAISAGDVTVTDSGEGHGVACAGDKPLRLVALIIYR